MLPNAVLPTIVKVIQTSLDLDIPVKLVHSKITIIASDLWEDHDLPTWATSPLLAKLVRRVCDLHDQCVCTQEIYEEDMEYRLADLTRENESLLAKLQSAQTQVANQSHSLSAIQEEALEVSSKKAELQKELRALSGVAKSLHDGLQRITREGNSAPIVEKPVKKSRPVKGEKPLPKVRSEAHYIALQGAAKALKEKPEVAKVQHHEASGKLIVTAFSSAWSQQLKTTGVYIYRGGKVPVTMYLL